MNMAIASDADTGRRLQSFSARIGRTLIEVWLQRLERRIERAAGRLDRAGLLDRNGRTRRGDW